MSTKFHPLFAGHYAMGLEDLGPDDPGIIATQSTHKQLAGFSQASQIHLKGRHIAGQSRHVSERRFNEAFLLHASTSPGFANEIQGVFPEEDPGGRVRLFTYVIRE